MKTKIAIVATAFFLVTIGAFAQEPVTFGVRAGVNFQNLTGKDATGDKFENDLKTGFHIGANAEIPVAPEFYVQPGLLFSTKGAKDKEGLIDITRNLNYLEIPVNFLYKPVLGQGKLLLGVGPYAAFAVGGTDKAGDEKSDVDFGNSANDDMKRFDAGANILAGYEFKNKLSFQLNAGLGLINLANRDDGDSESSLKNTGFGVSAGYRF